MLAFLRSYFAGASAWLVVTHSLHSMTLSTGFVAGFQLCFVNIRLHRSRHTVALQRSGQSKLSPTSRPCHAIDVSPLQDGYIMSWYMSYASVLINRYNTYTGECLLTFFDHSGQHRSSSMLRGCDGKSMYSSSLSRSCQPHLFHIYPPLPPDLSNAGIQYKNDPTIFSWELANEPRCQGSGTFSSSNQ